MSYRVIILFTTFFVTTNVFGVVGDWRSSLAEKEPDDDVVKNLGWIKDCNQSNLCCGHYFESSNIVNNPSPKPLKDMPMSVTAKEPAFFTQYGASVLQGDVVLHQPGREITADRVTFFRDDKTGKISRSLLYGKVNFREYGKLIVAEQGNLDFVNKAYSFNNGVYRLLADTPTGLASVWGQAKRAVSDESEILKLTRATYTSCPPDNTSWSLWGSKVNIDRNIGRGEITNGILYCRKIPVFYFPYYHFPIDKRRYSGFLIPTFNYTNNKFNTSLPYYFNLAPNYDALFSPEYYSHRGVLFQGLFRYLTPHSKGNANLNYIPHDKEFVKFRDSASISNNTYARALQSLKDSSADRGFASFQNGSKFDEHWQGTLDFNYATDDYFIENYPDSIPLDLINNDQLLNQAYIDYSGYNWNFFGRLQMFQTLHRITTTPGALDQYKKLPQIGVSGDFPDGFAGLDYRVDSEIVNFLHRDNFDQPESTPIVKGTRFNIMPTVSAPLDIWGASIIPKIQLQGTAYGLHDQPTSTAPNSIMRLYPFFSVDNKVILGRDFNVFNNSFMQTLEPRVFYLFVPKINQDNIPNFDTYSSSFDFFQLSRPNRFNGIDKVGDANQVAYMLTTRLLNDSGQERFNAGFGQAYALRKHQITFSGDPLISSGDPLVDHHLSSLTGFLSFNIYSVSPSVNFTWDPYKRRLSQATAGLGYSGPGPSLNVGYSYVADGDKFNGNPIDLKKINATMTWKIWRHWNIISNLDYNISYKRAENHCYGIEYDSCCWALRLMRSRAFIGVGADNITRYNSTYTLEFVLKGLGSYFNTFTSTKGLGRRIDEILDSENEYQEK